MNTKIFVGLFVVLFMACSGPKPKSSEPPQTPAPSEPEKKPEPQKQPEQPKRPVPPKTVPTETPVLDLVPSEPQINPRKLEGADAQDLNAALASGKWSDFETLVKKLTKTETSGSYGFSVEAIQNSLLAEQGKNKTFAHSMANSIPNHEDGLLKCLTTWEIVGNTMSERHTQKLAICRVKVGFDAAQKEYASTQDSVEEKKARENLQEIEKNKILKQSMEAQLKKMLHGGKINFSSEFCPQALSLELDPAAVARVLRISNAVFEIFKQEILKSNEKDSCDRLNEAAEKSAKIVAELKKELRSALKALRDHEELSMSFSEFPESTSEEFLKELTSRGDLPILSDLLFAQAQFKSGSFLKRLDEAAAELSKTGVQHRGRISEKDRAQAIAWDLIAELREYKTPNKEHLKDFWETVEKHDLNAVDILKSARAPKIMGQDFEQAHQNQLSSVANLLDAIWNRDRTEASQNLALVCAWDAVPEQCDVLEVALQSYLKGQNVSKFQTYIAGILLKNIKDMRNSGRHKIVENAIVQSLIGHLLRELQNYNEKNSEEYLTEVTKSMTIQQLNDLLKKDYTSEVSKALKNALKIHQDRREIIKFAIQTLRDGSASSKVDLVKSIVQAIDEGQEELAIYRFEVLLKREPNLTRAQLVGELRGLKTPTADLLAQNIESKRSPNWSGTYVFSEPLLEMGKQAIQETLQDLSAIIQLITEFEKGPGGRVFNVLDEFFTQFGTMKRSELADMIRAQTKNKKVLKWADCIEQTKSSRSYGNETVDEKLTIVKECVEMAHLRNITE